MDNVTAAITTIIAAVVVILCRIFLVPFVLMLVTNWWILPCFGVEGLPYTFYMGVCIVWVLLTAGLSTTKEVKKEK